MIINASSEKTSLTSAREIFGPDRFISTEEVWEKFDIEGISTLSKDGYLCAFNFLKVPFSAEELEARKTHSYLVPIHTFSLADLQRLLIHDENLSFTYKEDQIREQLGNVRPVKSSWKLIDEGPGLTKKPRMVKPKLNTLIQAALIIKKTRNINILAKGSICNDSVRYKEETCNPVVLAKADTRKFFIDTFLNLSDLSGPEYVISID